MSKVGKIFATMAIMASMADTRNYLEGVVSSPIANSPEWKRKKCKSCCHFGMGYQLCSKNTNHKACEKYSRRRSSS